MGGRLGGYSRAERQDASPSDDTGDGWRLVRQASAHGEAHDETLFALSDGWLGVRADFEERPGRSGGAFIADVYERKSIDYHERFPGFARATDTRMPAADGKHVQVRLGAQGYDLADGEILGCERALDLATGQLKRTTDWRLPGGEALRVTAERVACFRHPGLYPLRFTLESIDFAGPVALDATIATENHATAKSNDPRIGVEAAALPLIGWRGGANLAIAVQAMPSRGLVVLCGQTVRGGAAAAPERPGVLTARGELRPGARMTLEKFVAYEICAEDEAAIAEAANRLGDRLTAAAARGFDALAAEQAEELHAFWAAAEVCIAGEPALELALRLNLFHLRQSADPSGRHGLAVKGLTGEGYEGHVFWDAEIFMLPVLIHLQPDLARAHLEFRCRHLDGARAHAREMNFERGALYPWRTIGGAECSAYFPGGSAQIHINTAVARAIGLYLDATGDFQFLVDRAAEVLFETARIWLQAGFFDPRRDGGFFICGVTGPDEYTALVDNNFYTNLTARAHLKLARAIAERFEAEHPEAFAAMTSRIGLTAEERATWAAAAAAMHLPYDRSLGVHAQDDRFLTKPRFDLTAAAHRRPLLLHYHPLTLYRHQVCKQADAVLGLVLEGRDIPLEQKRRDFDYYEPITAHDSTLSATTFAVLAAEVNAPEAAMGFFRETTLVDLENLHDNTHHGAHMAAMAGSWLALVWGFAGLRIQSGRMTFKPTLPADFHGYSARMAWRGATFELSVRPDFAQYRLISGGPVEIEHEGERMVLEGPAPVRRPWGASAPLEAVIFDLDGVLTDTAQAHYRAWKRLADEIGAPFDAQANEQLKGVDRMTSLDILLARGGIDLAPRQRLALAERKNGYYRAEIADLGPGDLLPGARAALERTRAAGLGTALASASRNAPQIIAQLGIGDLLDAVVEVTPERRGKPAPDLFLAAAALVDAAPSRCLAVEDSIAGVAAIRAAGMTAIGVGDPAVLTEAQLTIQDLTHFQPRRPRQAN